MHRQTERSFLLHLCNYIGRRKITHWCVDNRITTSCCVRLFNIAKNQREYSTFRTVGSDNDSSNGISYDKKRVKPYLNGNFNASLKFHPRTATRPWRKMSTQNTTNTMNSSTNIQYAVQPPQIPSIPVNTDNTTSECNSSSTPLQFPIHRIYCVGRNYADHAIEMGSDPKREAPFFFCKPADATVLVDATQKENPHTSIVQIPYPSATNNLHYEIELIVAIGKGGFNIPVDDATCHVYGYAVGVDLTRRDLQSSAKKTGRPWCTAKAFDRSAPMSAIIPKHKFDTEVLNSTSDVTMWLKVNGEMKQTCCPKTQMIWSVAEILSHLSTYYELQPGDLIFTGTPAGVGQLLLGDIVTAGIGAEEDCITISFQISK